MIFNVFMCFSTAKTLRINIIFSEDFSIHYSTHQSGFVAFSSSVGQKGRAYLPAPLPANESDSEWMQSFSQSPGHQESNSQDELTYGKNRFHSIGLALYFVFPENFRNSNHR